MRVIVEFSFLRERWCPQVLSTCKGHAVFSITGNSLGNLEHVEALGLFLSPSCHSTLEVPVPLVQL